jgi:DNA repair protein RecO (recombination protein O)
VLSITEGIVLRTQKYGEADLIITYLTSDRGIIKAFAKSPRKTRSRFGSSLEPLTHARISLWGKEQSMPKITQSDIISSFQQLRESYDDYINISKLSEIIISLTPESIPNKRVFNLFLDILVLARSSGEGAKDALFLIAQVRLLAITGYAPGLKDCGKCGKKSHNFYPDSGTILCSRCASAQPSLSKKPPIRVADKTLSFYAHSIDWPLNITCRLKPPEEILSEFSLIIEKHLNHLLNKKLLSSEFRL